MSVALHRVSCFKKLMIGTRSATSLASHQSLPYGKRCASSFAPDAMAMQAGLDIFDVPARMIDEEAHSPLSPKERLWRDYLPSQFRPQAAPEKSPRQVDPASVETEQETTSQPPVVRVTTQKRVYSPPAVILFDGPARPQRQPETATRHRRSASSLSMPRPLIYTPPVPIIYDGPANPKRRKPVASTKADAIVSRAALIIGSAAFIGYSLYGNNINRHKCLQVK